MRFGVDLEHGFCLLCVYDGAIVNCYISIIKDEVMYALISNNNDTLKPLSCAIPAHGPIHSMRVSIKESINVSLKNDVYKIQTGSKVSIDIKKGDNGLLSLISGNTKHDLLFVPCGERRYNFDLRNIHTTRFPFDKYIK